MSETTKTSEAAKHAADNMVRSGQAAVDAAGKATVDMVTEIGLIAQESGESLKEPVTETVGIAANLSSAVVEQGRETVMTGMRAAAGAGGRVADIGLGRGHQMMSSAAHAMDIYRNASERSAERVQALFSSAMILGRGLQQMQHAWLEMVDRRMETTTYKPQDLLRCKNIVEFAEVQRDLYLDAVNHAFESTSRLLDMAGRTAQEAVRPLQLHHH
jgi:Phasin protein